MKAVGRPPRRRWLADLKADGLAWWVSASSDQRLQSVMHSHLRGVLLRQIFRTIRQRARPEKRINAVVEFRITGRRDGGTDRYRLTLADEGVGEHAADGDGGGREARRAREPDRCNPVALAAPRWRQNGVPR